MKKRIPVILFALLVLAGLCVLLYPSVSSWINNRNQTWAIQEYDGAVEELNTEEMQAQWELAEQYNRRFLSQDTDDLQEVEVPPDYLEVLNPGGNGIMGYLSIPTIRVYLPIYHDTNESVLKWGAGHIPETPLPIGGAGVHSVITGHRAMTTSHMLNDLDKLLKDDVFYLTILDKTLAYQVDQITVVEPVNIQDLLPVVGKDYVTLVTCTPYAVNSHRLLVRGIRIPYDPENPVEAKEPTSIQTDWKSITVLLFLALWMTLICIAIASRKRHRLVKSPCRKRRKASPWIRFIICLLVLCGVGLLLYPTISRMLYQRQSEQEFAEFLLERDTAQEEEESDPLLEAMHVYNRYLFEGGQLEGLENPLAFEETNTALQELGYTEEIFGYIQIPKMEIVLPIYLGSSQDNLNLGAAHMTWTSLPIGGENTNACVIGHRNLTRAEMFRNIELLEVGDAVHVFAQWGDLQYTVIETAVIWPNQTEHLLIQPGRDLLTLVSCYPRGSNIQRYLVICERNV